MKCTKCNSTLKDTMAKFNDIEKKVPCKQCLKCGNLIFNEEILKNAIREMRDKK